MGRKGEVARRWLPHAVVLAIALVTVSAAGATAGAPTRQLGVVTSPWQADDYSAALGANVGVIENFMPFGARADVRARLDEAASRGLTPLIAWLPRAPAAEVDQHAVQPEYANAAIASGGQDEYIRSFARTLATFPGPVILRYAPEMDGRWEPWHVDPYAYRAAWRHVWLMFQQEGATNVRFAWTTGLPASGGSFARWRKLVHRYWPGGRYVDLVGATTVSKHRQPISYWADRLHLLDSFAKPVVLPEVYAPPAWRSEWLQDFAALVTTMSRVEAVVWLDLDARHPLAGADAIAFGSIAMR